MTFNQSWNRLVFAVAESHIQTIKSPDIMTKVRVLDIKALLDDWKRLDTIVRANAAYEHGGKTEVLS